MISEKAKRITPSPTLAIDSKYKEMKANGEDAVGFGCGGSSGFSGPDGSSGLSTGPAGSSIGGSTGSGWQASADRSNKNIMRVLLMATANVRIIPIDYLYPSFGEQIKTRSRVQSPAPLREKKAENSLKGAWPCTVARGYHRRTGSPRAAGQILPLKGGPRGLGIRSRPRREKASCGSRRP